jgi:hypothetical protein
MISTIVLLSLVGKKALQKSQMINYPSAKILSLGLFLVAFGIFTYMVRDILTQFGLYRFQLMIGKTGIFFHTLGGVLILWFLSQNFVSESFKKAFFLVSILTIIIVLIGLLNFPVASQIIQAPFEPFPYKVIRQAPVGKINNLIIFIFILGPALLTGIILYHTLKLKEKKLRTKGLFYGAGLLFLFIPSLICLFISPIYARWGYLIGAILIYKAFGMKV